MSTTTTTTKPLTIREQALITAIDAGITTLRDLMDIADYTSTSVISARLSDLAERGYVVMETYGHEGFARVVSGRDYCSGWDLAARLAGNPSA